MSRVVVPEELELAVATHVGRVRTSNQDDYLILFPGAGERASGKAPRSLFAIADGMGGVAGGAQASRAALRALGACLAAGGEEQSGAELLGRGFSDAAERVEELAKETVGLADMGTTMTALTLFGARGVLAHIGDTRCLRIRGGQAEQLTVDHASHESRNLLTRAIGGGQRGEGPDQSEFEVRAGDIFVLLTDGVWGEVSPEELVQDLRAGSLQAGCERILGRVFERGAPDNATVLAVRVASVSASAGRLREVELPPGEARIGVAGAFGPGGASRWPTWPYALIGVSAALLLLAWLRLRHGFDLFDAAGLR
jgi:serine/threonine protein phosphatase PrpC